MRALEGLVKSKKDPDNSGDRFPEDVTYRSPRKQPRWVALEQRARTRTEDRSCTMSLIHLKRLGRKIMADYCMKDGEAL
jgi:hypothetical protein